MPRTITLSDETFELLRRHCEAQERTPDDVIRASIGVPLDREPGWLERVLVSAFESDEEYTEEEVAGALEGLVEAERGEYVTADELRARLATQTQER